MKIITDLTGQSVDGNYVDQGGIVQQVLDEPAKGFFRSTKLGRDAVIIKRGEHAVVIPHSVLRAFAELIEPALKPAPPQVESPAQPIQPV